MSEDCLATQKSSGNASTAPPETDNEDTGIKALLKELNQAATPTNVPSNEKQIVVNINDDEDLMEYIQEHLEYETCDLDHIVFELSSLIPTTFEANELNLLIRQYFDRTRSPGPDEERLDFAISIQELGVLFICDENSEKFRLLSNLGYSYKCRFKAHGQLDDIEQAIWNETQAVLLAGVDHMDLPVLLGNLGTSRWCRFERLGDAKDIEQAIKCQAQAVSLVPDDHPNIHTLLNDLGNSYHSRFESTGEPPDINMSIDCHRRAVSFALEEDEIWSARLNLGNSYVGKFLFAQLVPIGSYHARVGYHA
ncbi:hypothetical protein FRC09_004471 [Ceratobasidium sp. 395]|nr:hypothetical protein FRC09_004471 [Ceratobasidium sp. 395]